MTTLTVRFLTPADSTPSQRIGGMSVEERSRRVFADAAARATAEPNYVLLASSSQVLTDPVEPAHLPGHLGPEELRRLYDLQGRTFALAIPTNLADIAEELQSRQPWHDLSELAQQLSAALQLTVTDNGERQDLLAFQVGDADSAKAAEAALWQRARKCSDGFVARWLNRPVSLCISRILVDTRITPNQWTVLTLVLGLLGAWVTLQGSTAALLAGAITLQLCSIFDGVDGELARVRWQGTAFGKVLDTLSDLVVHFSYFIALTIATLRSGALFTAGAGLLGLVTWGAYTAFQLVLATRQREAHTVAIRMAVDNIAARPFAAAVRALRVVMRRDVFIAVALIAALLGRASAILWLVCAGGLITFGAAIVHVAHASFAKVTQGTSAMGS